MNANRPSITTSLHRLREYLVALEPGPIEDTSDLENLLSAAWEDLDGGDQEGMAGYKLHKRIENAEWSPPRLDFTIERHGEYCVGSSRAELQRWNVNVDSAVAECCSVGRRQKRAMQPRVNVALIVDVLASMILNYKDYPALTWKEETKVKIETSVIFPISSCCKQTRQGRLRRLKEVLKSRLSEHGWREIGRFVFAKDTP